MKAEGESTVWPKAKLSMHIAAEPSAEELLFARQLGVPCVYAWVGAEQRDRAFLEALRRKVEDAGLVLYNVGNMDVAKSDKIHLALPGRDEVIEEFQVFVRNLGEVGIHTTTFTWEPTRVWSSEPGETRGARARRVDLGEMRQRPYTHGRAYSEEELWENLAYFIQRMIPVAEESGVRLALHPNDPPAMEPLGGIPCLIHSWEDYERAFEIAASPALGMEFCCGCWLEGGAAFGDILAGIRHFVSQDRVLIVHFRNVSAPLPVFEETLLDNGYMDMYQVMKTLVETGYGGTVTLDHTPRFAPGYDSGTGTAYAIGYMRALMERAAEEAGGRKA
ncbi:MAG: mannonate dehydratase [Anaerolineae bacterium]|nr:mannonate dehydratase [Anaerolineae bacterium]